jgi:D-amino-acid dehydrogenase
MTRIGVIGAGISGVTAAYALRERGYDVTVFDQNRYAAMETSFANGGQLSASNAEVWNKVSTVLQGIQWMMRRDAPLLMNPMPSWHKYSWMMEFCANIPKHRKNTLETVRLAIESRRHMFAMAERENIDFDLKREGILHFYRDKASFDKAAKANEIMVEGGLERRAVTPEEIRQIEPTLKGSYYGGFFTPSDSTGDIHKFTRGLADACARHGVRFFYDAQVEKIVPKDGGFEVRWLPVAPDDTKAAMDRWRPIPLDAVVISAGVWSRRFAAMLGDRLNIYPVKGYSITVHLHTPEAQAAAPSVSILDEATKIVTSRLGDDRFRVAGTAEFSGYSLDIRYDRIKPLINWSREQFPGMTTDRVVAWCGLRPMMPDMMPRVGPGRRSGVFYHTGHGHLGWTLSAGTAQILADAVEKAMPVESKRIAAKPAADAA